MATLKEKFATAMGPMKERVQKLNKEFGDVNVSTVNVGQIVGGARDIISMLWDVSLLDKFEGIRFRGFSIPELREKLPKAPGGTEPLPEGIFYLLLLGEIPTAGIDDEEILSRLDHVHVTVLEQVAQAALPLHVERQRHVALRVAIDDEHLHAAQRETVGQVHGGDGFTHPTFLVDNSQDGHEDSRQKRIP